MNNSQLNAAPFLGGSPIVILGGLFTLIDQLTTQPTSVAARVRLLVGSGRIVAKGDGVFTLVNLRTPQVTIAVDAGGFLPTRAALTFPTPPSFICQSVWLPPGPGYAFPSTAVVVHGILRGQPSGCAIVDATLILTTSAGTQLGTTRSIKNGRFALWLSDWHALPKAQDVICTLNVQAAGYTTQVTSLTLRHNSITGYRADFVQLELSSTATT
jgi:hypothetical protein